MSHSQNAQRRNFFNRRKPMYERAALGYMANDPYAEGDALLEQQIEREELDFEFQYAAEHPDDYYLGRV